MWNQERLKESCGSPMGGLLLTTRRTSLDELASACLQGGPPEVLEQDISTMSGTGVTGLLGGVGPLQSISPQCLRDIQAIRWKDGGTWLPFNGSSHPLLNDPGKSGNNTGRRNVSNRAFS